jgi:effector-binding domain-containing protein
MSAIQIVDVPESFALVRRTRCRNEQLGPEIGRLYGEIMHGNPDAELAAPPCVYYTLWEPDECEIEAALPVDPASVPHPASELKTYPACRAVRYVHIGPLEQLHESWMRFWEAIRVQGHQPSGRAPWDCYITDPGEVEDPSELQTELYVPLS